MKDSRQLIRQSNPGALPGASLLVNRLLENALRDKVNDLLVEPSAEGYRILESYADAAKATEVHRGLRDEYVAVRDQLKDLSRMALDTHDIRQRGAFQFESAQGVVDIRVMADPGSTGEWVHVTFGQAPATVS